MTKLFEDIKEGLEEAIAYSEENTLIEEENQRIEEKNNPHFWLQEGKNRKVYGYIRQTGKTGHTLKKITRLQALCEHESGTEFSPQALEKLGVK